MTQPRVATAEQARTLLRQELFPLLTALIGGPISVGELAPRVQASLRQVYHHLQTLLEAGVAEVAGERPRAGRAIKLYWVPAPWFIPFEVTGAAHLTEFLGSQLLPRLESIVALGAAQLLAEGPDWGYWLEADRLGLGTPAGLLSFTQGLPTPLALSVGGLRLGPVQARAFQERLEALLEEYGQLSGTQTGGQTYSIAVLLTR